VAPTAVIMPKLGVYTEDVLLLEWVVDEGAAVSPGDVLFVLETEKTTAEVEAESPGFLHRQVEAGEKVAIGSSVGAVAATREEYEALVAEEPAHPFLGYIGRGGPESTMAPVAPAAPRVRDGSAPISPRARALLARHGLDAGAVAHLAGSGPGGRIVDRDVAAFLEQRGGAGVAKRLPLRGRRGTIARRMVESLQTAAQLTSVLELDAAPVAELRRATGASYTAIFVHVVARALRQHPLLNSRIAGDEIELLEDVNVGVAVEVPEGLIVPVVHGADRLSLDELHARCTELVEAARADRLAPEDVAGGTFTLSNAGIHPIDLTTAILNPPQSALLWLGRIRERPVALDGEVVVRPTVQACLTYDHRAVDGAPAAAFLGTLERLVGELA
jgi:pyruvate/2-oxoglutarate dehydrogenase complex dihydrolipoamide acyltransferase (E2) component